MRSMVAERGVGEPVSLGGALLAGKKVAPDATTLLTEDHRIVAGWFEWFERVPEDAREAVIGKRICTALLAHMAAEEEFFYPLVEAATGKRNLVDEAVKEHQKGRDLIARLQGAQAVDDDYRETMRTLRSEIEHHIVEEETKVFPAARASGMDLYAAGAFVAARRVDALFNMVGRVNAADAQLSEVVHMPIAIDEARDFFILGLKNAHASARQGQTMLEAQARRLDDYPALQAKLEEHLQFKRTQLGRLEDLLDRYGESRSALKEVAMTMAAGMTSMAAATADDEVLKNSFAAVAQTRFMIAAYEGLLALGEAAGEAQALRPIQQSLSEERGLAAFLEANTRGTTIRFLELRSAAAG